jgi:hypothetical protein
MAVDDGHVKTNPGRVRKLAHARLTPGSARTDCPLSDEQWNWVSANPLYLDSEDKFGDVRAWEGRATLAGIPMMFMSAYTQEFYDQIAVIELVTRG